MSSREGLPYGRRHANLLATAERYRELANDYEREAVSLRGQLADRRRGKAAALRERADNFEATAAREAAIPPACETESPCDGSADRQREALRYILPLLRSGESLRPSSVDGRLVVVDSEGHCGAGSTVGEAQASLDEARDRYAAVRHGGEA